jgi:N-formylglutamate deformylase
MQDVFRIISPKSSEVPILLSVPHCGTAFPEGLIPQFVQELIKSPDDTDWFVDTLYDFAAELGIGMIAANYSRWVIDLNRDPQSKPLYSDGRIITALCPATTFMGQPIYNDERKEVDAKEIQRRQELYFNPYHQKIQEQLDALKKRHGKVLLWDCHSIRQLVPTIQKEKFPDMILGDADATTASPGLIETVLGGLDHSDYSVSHNQPFKGGFITRYFGRPSENQHALQLEMTKVNYMNDEERHYDKSRAERVRTLLKSIFEKLIERL